MSSSTTTINPRRYTEIINVLKSKKLESLTLQGQIKFDPSDLINLRELNIMGNLARESSSIDLTPMTKLEKISLVKNEFDNIQGIASVVSKLKLLYIDEARFEKALPSIPTLNVSEDLEQLYFSYYPNVEGWNIPNNLPNCIYFRATDTNLSLTQIEKLVDAIYANGLEEGVLFVDGETNGKVVIGSPTEVKLISLRDDRNWSIAYNALK